MKRYPQARLFTLIYMVRLALGRVAMEMGGAALWHITQLFMQLLLHVWVMVVLLTYSPEMHDTHPGAL